ncbi:hypothetical protein B484DRAFT_406969 [Ochromonadaceae sp. CCMP2298]|nr:hypothetical protein B484DRAFT_406969 [Ochromonadaceae sp. CCMP2298]|mmetsp:Transcript_7461/g.16364  ORF Transcript_7461/g.16364 Transcript_7461/m.16364 type:complete len:201 (+) Transcript_7461:147-749(+)
MRVRSLVLLGALLASQVLASVEHSARIEEIVSVRAAESHSANDNANELLVNGKVRLEGHLASAKQQAAKLSDAKFKPTNTASIKRPAVARAQREKLDPSHPEHKMRAALKAHGVSDGLMREINNMASSQIPREAIIQHVQTHFPNKAQHEWNEIVVSAIAVRGNRQPDMLDMKKANREELVRDKNRFQQAKKSLGQRTEL